MLSPLLHKMIQIIRNHDENLIELRITVNKAELDRDKFFAQLMNSHEDAQKAFLRGWVACEEYYQNNNVTRFGNWYKPTENTDVSDNVENQQQVSTGEGSIPS